MRSVRIATALYLIIALPGLVFGWLLRVAPLELPCEPTGLINLINTLHSPTSGELCRSIDYTVLYWLVPAVVLVVIGVGIALAREERGRRGVSLG